MKIRYVKITNFRRFVGTVRVDGLDSGINVLVGRNELGKSTLLEAINAVFFEKARSASQHVRNFRHCVNGTVPEVELQFELDSKMWTIYKRFAYQSGKTILTCSDNRRFEEESAEVELQRLLGFSRAGNTNETGIWGTLWVKQGQSFGDLKLDDNARRTLRGCLEAQVGEVTGGKEGQKIPNAIKASLREIRSIRGPSGKYKETIDRCSEFEGRVAELENKRKELFGYMDDLASQKRELARLQGEWDQDEHERELKNERGKREAAATQEAKIEAACSAANLAWTKLQADLEAEEARRKQASDLEAAEREIAVLDNSIKEGNVERGTAAAEVEELEASLSDFRKKSSIIAERSRYLNRLRSTVSLAGGIRDCERILEKARELEAEASKVTEEIGGVITTDEDVRRIEEAILQITTAEAAKNAVATTVSFELEETGQNKVRVNGEALEALDTSQNVVSTTNVELVGIGKITIEPHIKNRNKLVKDAEDASSHLRATLDAAGTKDIATARQAAALRQRLERDLANIRRQIEELAPGNLVTNLAPGLEALRSHVTEQTARLAREMELLSITAVPESEKVNSDIQEASEIASQLEKDMFIDDGKLSGLRGVHAEKIKDVQQLEIRLAGFQTKADSARANLAASRADCSDEALNNRIKGLESDVTTKNAALESLEKQRGDSVEIIDSRIKRLEGAAVNYSRSVNNLNQDITRLSTLISANEGAGIEENLDFAKAEVERLTNTVRHYEEESDVLQLLINTIDTAEREAKARFLAPVLSRVEPYLKTLLPGAALTFDEDLRISGMERDGLPENFEQLSEGTQEQLAVLTRLAFAELLHDQEQPAMVILDDALAFSDDERIERMFDILMHAGDRIQILVLTCRKRLFNRLGATMLQITSETFPS